MEKEGFETKKGILLNSWEEHDKLDGETESSDIKESSTVNDRTVLAAGGNKSEKENLKNVSSHDGEILKLQSEVSEVGMPQVLKDGLEKESFPEVRELDAPTVKMTEEGICMEKSSCILGYDARTAKRREGICMEKDFDMLKLILMYTPTESKSWTRFLDLLRSQSVLQ